MEDGDGAGFFNTFSFDRQYQPCGPKVLTKYDKKLVLYWW
jgi:hypothetical protein